MNSSNLRLFVAMIVLATTSASAQHKSNYAGQHLRAIKAISSEDITQYLAGAGMGYAKAAELNGYPGPMHVLELAEKLGLSNEQREATRTLMEQHKVHARKLGAKKIEAERELDALFRTKDVEPERLSNAVRAAAHAEGEYRHSHLETHRRMHALLSEQQILQYGAMRGYSDAAHGH